jgi:2-haloacid dehalogenase
MIGRRRFVQLLASLPLICGAALARTIPPEPSGGTISSTQGTIRPKALVFDMQGTVLNFYGPMMHELAQIPSIASHLQQWSTFAGRWSASAHDAIVEIAAGRMPWQPNSDIYATALTPLLPRYPGGETLSDDDKRRLLGVWARMKPWNDSVPGLAALRTDFVIATLTNASTASMVEIVKRNALPFDAVLTGEMVHTFKPNPRVYQLGCDYLGFAPGEIMLVSAHKWDLMAAKHSGLLTAFVPRPYESGPATKVDTSFEPYIDITAADLPHLASLLHRS